MAAGIDWDARFSAPGYAYGEAPNEFLVSVADRIPAGKVLSLGEGEGRNALFLAKRGHEVTALDASAVGLKKALARAQAQGIEIQTVLADLAASPLPEGPFSGVISIFCHLPPALRRSVHQQAMQRLSPGGVFIAESYLPDQLRHGTGGPRMIDLLVTLDDLRSDLPGMRFEIGREIEREVHEGQLHNGLSSVVQVVAIKEPA